jgi:uncharacterized membrane protein YwzB
MSVDCNQIYGMQFSIDLIVACLFRHSIIDWWQLQALMLHPLSFYGDWAKVALTVIDLTTRIEYHVGGNGE